MTLARALLVEVNFTGLLGMNGRQEAESLSFLKTMLSSNLAREKWEVVLEREGGKGQMSLMYANLEFTSMQKKKALPEMN